MKPTDLTPEQVMETGKIWAETIIASLPADEVLSRYGLEERLKGLKPEERLKGLKPEEIDAYLRRIRKKT